MKTIRIKGKFRKIKIFENGKLNNILERSKGNETKSLIIEFDEDIKEINEWKDVINKDKE